MENNSYIFQGTAFTSKSKKEIYILKDYLFCIDDQGIIKKVVAPDDPLYSSFIHEYEGKDNFHRLEKGQYILPGFVDLHVHAPQCAQSGTALDIPLNDWLHTYTFPLEAKYSDIHFAEKVYDDLVTKLLANGTTTALYFATT